MIDLNALVNREICETHENTDGQLHLSHVLRISRFFQFRDRINAMSKLDRTISHPQRRDFIRRGHALRAQTTVGRQGLTDAFITQLDQTMRKCDLLKIRIEAESADDATQIAESLAQRIGAELVQRVGRVALIYRPVAENDLDE